MMDFQEYYRQNVKPEVDKLYEEFISSYGYKDCVDSCKLTYDACVDGGFSNCRDKLESCINSCPSGESISPENSKKLTEFLDRLDALYKKAKEDFSS